MDEDLESVLPPSKDDFPFPCKRVIPYLPSVTERYFEPRFFLPSPSKKLITSGHQVGQQCIFFHSNRIGLVSIASSHPLLRSEKCITKVDFQINYKTNRLDNKVSGKSKRGGQKVAETSLICVVNCNDGTSYAILAGMKGTLIEVNDKLASDPNLIREKPWSKGYFAIILPSFKSFKVEKDNLLTYEKFKEKTMAEKTMAEKT